MAGETVDLSTQDFGWKPHGKAALGMLAKTWECVAGELETDDQYLVGYLPDGATVVAAIFKTDDLDTDASVALVWTLLIGSTTFATCANDTAKAGTTLYGDHVTCSGNTPVYLKATTAAATQSTEDFTINLAVEYIGT